MTPYEVKFALDATLLAMAQSGKLPVIIGVHSVCVEGDTVHVGFDILPGDEPLFFVFELPATVGRDDLPDFSRWLARSSHEEMTRH
jgi:hypothetical protein